MLNAFYPVVAGRTSDSLRRSRMLYQVQVDQIALQDIQEQLSTGLRYSRISEDPTSAIRVLGLQSDQEFNLQVQSNLRTSQGFLTATESNLSELQSLINEARGLAVGSIDSTRTQTEREAIGSQIDAILERAMSIGNSRFLDRSLFAGGKVRNSPLSEFQGHIRFGGNELDLLAASDLGNLVEHNITSQSAFGVLSEGVTSNVDLNPSITPATRISDLNSGRGIPTGAIQFSNGNEQVIIDLDGVSSIREIKERIDSVSVDGRQLELSINSNGLELNYADGLPGTLRVSDVGVGAVAAALGLETNAPSPTLPIVGGDLDPILRLTTQVSQFDDGNGFDLQGGILIRQGDQDFRVELAQAQTVEDIINRINRSGAAVIADLDPSTNQLRVRSYESGTDFSIGESQGTLATRLGLRTFNAQTRVADLNYGRGLLTGDGPDLELQRIDGNAIQVELQGAITIQDVLDRINLHVDNQVPTQKITASLNASGNGITLTSPGGGTEPLTVRVSGGSEAAWNLGLLPFGETERTATFDGTSYVLAGSDSNPQEVRGIFNSLVRLRNAVFDSDLDGISRAAQTLDEDIDRLSKARGDLGIEQQRIDSLILISESKSINIQSQVSEERDADLAQVISELTSRQAAQEASLNLLGQTARLSLFDFL